MRQITVVPMEERHLPALAEIERACFHAPWSENALREELGKGLFLVAEDQNQTVCGYVGCQTVLDEGYITNVAVSPGFRRQGIGRQLIQALTERAQQAQLAFVTLEVRASNAPAIALYTAAGYEPVGRRKNFYRSPTEDAILMTLYLHEKGKIYHVVCSERGICQLFRTRSASDTAGAQSGCRNRVPHPGRQGG